MQFDSTGRIRSLPKYNRVNIRCTIRVNISVQCNNCATVTGWCTDDMLWWCWCDSHWWQGWSITECCSRQQHHRCQSVVGVAGWAVAGFCGQHPECCSPPANMPRCARLSLKKLFHTMGFLFGIQINFLLLCVIIFLVSDLTDLWPPGGWGVNYLMD